MPFSLSALSPFRRKKTAGEADSNVSPGAATKPEHVDVSPATNEAELIGLNRWRAILQAKFDSNNEQQHFSDDDEDDSTVISAYDASQLGIKR